MVRISDYEIVRMMAEDDSIENISIIQHALVDFICSTIDSRWAIARCFKWCTRERKINRKEKFYGFFGTVVVCVILEIAATHTHTLHRYNSIVHDCCEGRGEIK